MGETGAIVGSVGSLAQAGTSIYGGIQQSDALKAQGELSQQAYELRAQRLELQAKDALRRGQFSESALRKQSKQLSGRQRASIAAQGIQVDTGSAAEIQSETATMTTQDAIQIQNNAWREAWGFRYEAQDSRTQGVYSALEASNKSAQTLLTSGLQATGSALEGLKTISPYVDSGSFNAWPYLTGGLYGG